MKDRALQITSRIIFASSILLVIASQILFFLNRDSLIPASWDFASGIRNSRIDWLHFSSLGILLPTVAGVFSILITLQHPTHPIGWLLSFLGLTASVSTFTGEWAIYGYYTVAAGLPGALLAAWVKNWVWMFVIGCLLLLLPIFPDGKFLSAFWRYLFFVPFTLFFISGLSASNLEATLSSAYQIPSLIILRTPENLYKGMFVLVVVAIVLTSLVIVANVWVRFCNSLGLERQQMKWLITGTAGMACMIIPGFVIGLGAGQVIGNQLVNNSFILPLISIGIAITRHRLYDIDLLIRRTLVYTSVTIFLVAGYLSGVTLLQSIVTSLSGQQSTLAIVISTLCIAALFNPLRYRVQQVIDRRFYRHKYSAEQTLAEFRGGGSNRSRP